MRIYRLDPNKLERERLTIKRMYLTTLGALAVGSIVFVLVRRLPLGALWWLPLIGLLLLYYLWGALRKNERLFDEYSLEWDGKMLQQNTPGMPEQVVQAVNIREVERHVTGLMLSTEKHHNILTISRLLKDEDLNALEAELSAFASQNKAV